MNADQSIYDLIKNMYNDTYFNKFAQSVKLDESNPKILIKNITHNNYSTKDTGREEYIYRIEIIGTNYINVWNCAEIIKQEMVNFTDQYVYHCVYDAGFYDTNETAEIHRIIRDFRIYTNNPYVTQM